MNRFINSYEKCDFCGQPTKKLLYLHGYHASVCPYCKKSTLKRAPETVKAHNNIIYKLEK